MTLSRRLFAKLAAGAAAAIALPARALANGGCHHEPIEKLPLTGEAANCESAPKFWIAPQHLCDGTLWKDGMPQSKYAIRSGAGDPPADLHGPVLIVSAMGREIQLLQ